MLSLGSMLVPGLTLSPVSAQPQPVDEEELVGELLDDLGIIDEEEEEDEDEVVWCYLRQGDVRVCFETQEECQQALDDDDLSVTSHCERFETPPPNAVFP